MLTAITEFIGDRALEATTVAFDMLSLQKHPLER